jgi:phosphoglycerate dehydrogenase-like enzyme
VALDVLSPEPPESDHPRLTSEGVLATPHGAVVTDVCLYRSARPGAGEIEAALSGDHLDGVLDSEVFD